MTFKSFVAGAALATLLSAAAGSAGAVVITNGVISAGVNTYGQLISTDEFGVSTGLKYNDGPDVIYGGGPRDSWGANNAFADEEGGFSAGFDPANASLSGVTASSATSTVLTDDGLQVAQVFSFAADNILAIDVTLTNTTGDALSTLFQRLADFDVDPDSNETVFDPYGNTVENTYVGFFDASVYSPWDPFGCYAAGCSIDYDAGAGFRFDLGSLGAGQSLSVRYFYGIGGDPGALAAQMNALGVTNMLVATGADRTLSAAMGVIGPAAVPEPATWAMMLVGFFGLGAMLRRRGAALA